MATEINPFIGNLANRGGYSVDAIYAIPYLAEDINRIINQVDYPRARNAQQASVQLSKAMKDPVAYVTENLQARIYERQFGDSSNFDKSIAYLRAQNVPENKIQESVTSAVNGLNASLNKGQDNNIFSRLGRGLSKFEDVIIRPVVAPVSAALAKVEDVVKEDVLPNPLFQVALAVYMPTIASYLGPYLTAIPAAYQSVVAGALANTALQTAQGVPFEQALKSATINAVTSTGAPAVADYMLPYVGSTQVADALTSIGASAAKTAAMGGSKDDIEKNMVAALTGSSLTSALQAADVSRETSRIAGATAGGAVVGGTTGAVMGAAGEAGAQLAAEQAAKDAALERAKKGIAAADTGTVSDSSQQLGDVVVTGKREPTITDTNIITPTGPISDREVIGAMQPPASVPPVPTNVPSLAPVTVIGTREPTIQDTDITLPETTVIGKREEDTLPEVNVTGKREEDPIAEKPVEEEPPVDDKGEPYRPNLFIYGGTKPSTLTQTLRTNIPTASTTTGTSVGLGGRGEIESKESGKKRQTVWNEESLRLKDALGL